MSDLDAPQPEDFLERPDGLPDDLPAIVVPDEIWHCQALVLTAPFVTSTCGRETERACVIEPRPGLTIWYALCDEHATGEDDLLLTPEETRQIIDRHIG